MASSLCISSCVAMIHYKEFFDACDGKDFKSTFKHFENKFKVSFSSNPSFTLKYFTRVSIIPSIMLVSFVVISILHPISRNFTISLLHTSSKINRPFEYIQHVMNFLVQHKSIAQIPYCIVMKGSFNTSITRLDFPQPVIPFTTIKLFASNSVNIFFTLYIHVQLVIHVLKIIEVLHQQLKSPVFYLKTCNYMYLLWNVVRDQLSMNNVLTNSLGTDLNHPDLWMAIIQVNDQLPSRGFSIINKQNIILFITMH
ncbi:hypothetical protein AGLY_004692, partial [Aphis glycines]